MRFMILVKATKNSEAGVLPDEKLLTAMGKYNEELAKAGVLLAAEGLQPSSKGARVRFSGNKRTVIDGPFAETKELIAGFWLWQVKAGDQLLRLGERPVDHGALVSREPDPRALRTRLEPLGREQHAGFRQLLVVLSHRGQELLVRKHAGL